jgi:hypothetical protein
VSTPELGKDLGNVFGVKVIVLVSVRSGTVTASLLLIDIPSRLRGLLDGRPVIDARDNPGPVSKSAP